MKKLFLVGNRTVGLIAVRNIVFFLLCQIFCTHFLHAQDVTKKLGLNTVRPTRSHLNSKLT